MQFFFFLRSLFSVSQLLRIAFSVFHDIFFILFFFERKDAGETVIKLEGK
jgi:hypothetical protein